jgi:DNA mismatch endonuclease (patch repair protein)
MADIVAPEVRSRMMSGIRATDTKPELLLRRALHARGFRFRLHHRGLPGRPDMVFARWNAVIFAHGCFWHGHDCSLFRWPATRADFWRAKIERNRENDLRAAMALQVAGWRQGVVWECALKGPGRLDLHNVITQCARWLHSGNPRLEIRGRLI